MFMLMQKKKPKKCRTKKCSTIKLFLDIFNVHMFIKINNLLVYVDVAHIHLKYSRFLIRIIFFIFKL
jgi:hypothetical protein